MTALFYFLSWASAAWGNLGGEGSL